MDIEDLYKACRNANPAECLQKLDSLELKQITETEKKYIYLLRLMSESMSEDQCFVDQFQEFIQQKENEEIIISEQFSKIINRALDDKCESWEKEIIFQTLFEGAEIKSGYPYLTESLGFYFLNEKDFDRARLLFEGALKEFQEVENFKKIERVLYDLSLVEKNSGNMQGALAIWKDLLTKNSQIIDTTLYVYVCQQYTGYVGKTEYGSEGLEFALKALNLANQTSIKTLKWRANACVGKVFYGLGDFSNSLAYHQDALKFAEQIGDTKKISYSLNSVGISLGDMQYWEEAQAHFEASLEAGLLLKNNEKTISNRYHNIGATYLKLNNLDSADRYLSKAIAINSELAKNADFLTDHAELKFRKDDLNGALTESSEALTFARERQNLNRQLTNLALLKSIYRKKGKQKKVLEIDQEFDEVYALWQNEIKGKEVARMTVLHQTEELRRQVKNFELEKELRSIQLQNRTLSRNFWFVSTLGAMFLALLIWKFWRDQKRAREHTEKMMQELHHRVKNNLEMLSGMFTIQASQTKDAKLKLSIAENEARVTAMNLIHRRLYHQDDQLVVDLDTYLDEVLENLEDVYSGKHELVLKSSFPKFKIRVEKAITLGLLVNELCTNSFKYAKVEDELKLECAFEVKDNRLIVLTWKDNGADMANLNGSGGFGTKLIELLSNQLKAEHETLIDSGMKHLFYFKKIKGA